jgi:hypothetical protein
MRTNSFLGALTLNLAFPLLAACTDPIEPTIATHESAVSTCYNFSSLTGSFAVGDVFNAADVTASFLEFQFSSGLWTAVGTASAVTSSNAGGTPVDELNLSNILMRVTPDTASTGVSYRYADMGGNVNFGVNGDFRNVADISSLDGTVVGGCDIMVTRTNIAGGYRGFVVITPQSGVTIERFAVGGQEFFVDDVCH